MARKSRHLPLTDPGFQQPTGLVAVRVWRRNRQGDLKTVPIESLRHVEGDAKQVECTLVRKTGTKCNILVMNGNALHGHRIHGDEPDEDKEDLSGEGDEGRESCREATVRVGDFVLLSKGRTGRRPTLSKGGRRLRASRCKGIGLVKVPQPSVWDDHAIRIARIVKG